MRYCHTFLSQVKFTRNNCYVEKQMLNENQKSVQLLYTTNMSHDIALSNHPIIFQYVYMVVRTKLTLKL